MRDHDKITLLVNGTRYDRFISYEISHNLYSADSNFQFTPGRPSTKICAGDECRLYINDVLAMTGIVDSPEVSYSKTGITHIVTGRDIIGLVVDQYVTKWQTYKGKTLRYLAETLLQEVPIVSKKEIVFDPGAEKLNVTGDAIQTEPGQTVFDVLKSAAVARGLLFYANSAGQFVFGKPKSKEAAQCFFTVKKKPGGGYYSKSNILTGKHTADSMRHYRTIIVTGENSEGEQIYKEVTDETAPIAKTMVMPRNDSTALGAYCQNIIDQQRFSATGLQYKVSGHSQNGRVFAVNTVGSVYDDALGMRGDYLLYGVGYSLSKKEGITSTLSLGPGGMV